MKKLAACVLFLACYSGQATAHTPLFSCYDLGDNIILCEGGFSDGSSAAGVEVVVLDGAGKSLLQSEINGDGEIEFAKPAGGYQVIFNAGPGHSIALKGEDIVE